MGWELVLLLSASFAISAGCLMPANWLPPLPHDKFLHFIAFGGLMLLAGRIAQSGSQLASWMLGLFLAGWAIECLQILVPGRKFCWRDMAANTAGILVAALYSLIHLM